MNKPTDEQLHALVEKLTKAFVNKGKLIESGWVAMDMLSLQDASSIQRSEMRKAFFFGAQHLFASIMYLLEEGDEPTDSEMNRMDQIQKELEEFVKEQKANREKRN